MKLYDWGEHWENFNWNFGKLQFGWYLTNKYKFANKRQKQQLKFLGWGKADDLTFNGAEAIIQEIIENTF